MLFVATQPTPQSMICTRIPELLYAPAEGVKHADRARCHHHAFNSQASDFTRESVGSRSSSRRESGVASRTGRAANVARKTLNGIAAEPAAVPELKRDGRIVLIGGTGTLLATLAREAVRLFGREAAQLIRQCEAPTCTLCFLDTSRRGDRRWCSMLACGNRAKVAEFRRRRATDGPQR
jgi:predicted RNA-binding Zn ribbon-like protein